MKHLGVLLVILVACGGSKPAPTTPPTGGSAVATKPDAPAATGPCEIESECSRRCDAGDAPSCTTFGLRMKKKENASEEDRFQALTAFKKACEKKHPEGCYHVGMMVTDDKTELEVYAIACEGNWADACTNLGAKYGNGEGVAADPARARELAEKSCKLGDQMGCSNLGMYLRDGLGGATDFARAQTLLRAACDASEGPACSRLARMADEGQGMPKDQAMARKIYARACELDAGCNNLGVMYFRGEGGPKDVVKAKEAYKKACDQDDAHGCFNLGQIWRDGDDRDKVNLALAAELIDKGCRLGHKGACDALSPVVDEAKAKCEKNPAKCTNYGYLHRYGIGVKESKQTAMKLYEKACKAGEPTGCENLGSIYTDDKDPKLALEFYQRACKLGSDDGCAEAAKRRTTP